jgi:hypothetical protein
MPLKDAAAIGTFMAKGLRHPASFYSSVGPTLNELSFGHLGPSFKPEKDIPDLSGKVAFVTGGNWSPFLWNAPLIPDRSR